jgi:hypothetical protein
MIVALREHLRDAKIDDFEDIIGVKKEIIRFNIPMDDAVSMDYVKLVQSNKENTIFNSKHEVPK